jgi:hypothetical protein
MKPIALTQEQLGTVMGLARLIPRGLRDEYLQGVAERLRGKKFDDRDVVAASNEAMRRIISAHSQGRRVSQMRPRAEPGKYSLARDPRGLPATASHVLFTSK